jgi:HK97 gp10 family phage protein
MPDVKLTVSPSLDKVAKGYKLASKNTIKDMGMEIKRLALSVERYAKQVTPVDTGRLRGSISTEMGGGNLSATVGTHSVKYASFVHEGTSRMGSRPFMKHGLDYALEKAMNHDFPNRLDKSLRESLTKL